MREGEVITGYVLVEGMRPDARHEGLPLTLARIVRDEATDPGPGQPKVWTSVEFTFPREEAPRVAAALASVLDARGGWYTNFTVGDETFVIFADRVLRYSRGDEAAKERARAYGRSVGVPERQLDWHE